MVTDVFDILDFIYHWSTDRDQNFLKGHQIEVLYTISISTSPALTCSMR